jgi:hypothetical protein
MFTEADHELTAYASRHFDVFTLEEAREFFGRGEIRWRMEHAWDRLHEGVYIRRGLTPTWRAKLYAACRAVPAPIGASHRSGAALYLLPMGSEPLTEVTCRRWFRSQRPGLLVHESTRFSHEDLTEIDGIPVVTPELLILQLAGLKPYPNHVEKIIQAARRKRLITYDSTLATFNRLARRGVPGVKAMRIALERWDPTSKPTHSEMETMLIQVLRDAGLPEPVTQFRVLDQYGNFVADADAGLPQWKITIEYQSKQEHLDEFQTLRDDRRRNAVLAAGYFPLVARSEDLRSGGHRLVDEIEQIARRCAS